MKHSLEDLLRRGLNARQAHAFVAWENGADLTRGRSKTTFYRLRKDIRHATGEDIAVLQPRSSVVPFRRKIVATQVGIPSWADELTSLIEQHRSSHPSPWTDQGEGDGPPQRA